MKPRLRLLARRSHGITGAVISEYVSGKTRRFTATIRGWNRWPLWEGVVGEVPLESILNKVREIRDRIDAGDESVFEPTNGFLVTQ